MIFLPKVVPGAPLAFARSVGADPRGWPLGSLSSTAAHRPISQGVVALWGISGRVLNTVEIAPRCNIAICEFRVSFRGTPAY